MEAIANCFGYLSPKSLTFTGVLEFMVYVFSTTLLVVTSWSMREFNDFTCSLEGDQFKNKDFIYRKCYAKYEMEYEKVPQFALIAITFAVVAMIRFSYVLYVEKRVSFMRKHKEADKAYKREIMKRSLFESKVSVYSAYQLHIIFRVAVMLLFIFLTVFLYPKTLPDTYLCSRAKSSVINAVSNRNSSTSALNKTTATTEFPVVCQDLKHKGKNLWKIIAIICFVAMIFISLIDLLIVRFHFVHKAKDFANDIDYEFCSFLLKGKDNETDATIRDAELGDVPLESSVTVSNFINKMKHLVLSHTKTINVFQSEDERVIRLDEIFTNIVLQHGRVKYDPTQKERYKVEDRFTKITNEIIEKPENIFVANDKVNDEHDPRTILIRGRAGIGKTVLCMKLVQDWAKRSNSVYQKFKFVFLNYFRNNDFSDKSLTLKTFLECSPVCPDPLDDLTFEYIKNNPESVLIVIDGFDEYKPELGDKNIFLCELLSGKFLPGATIIITSRPEAIEKLKQFHCNFDRSAEILGFSPKQVKEYISKYCGSSNESVSTTLWKNVERNKNLLHFCYVPINCFLVCSYLADNVKNLPQLPSSLAGLYESVLNHFFSKHHSECKDKTEAEKKIFLEKNEEIEKLSYVAYHFLKQRQFDFKDSELNEIILHDFGTVEDKQVTELKESCLLHRIPNCKIKTHIFETFYCFIHLTVQEFLAAKMFVKNKCFPPVSKEWFTVIQFIAGLLASRGQNGRFLMKQLVEKIIKGNTRERDILITRCLCEYGQKKVAQELLNELDVTALYFDYFLGVSDILSIAFVIENTHVQKIQLSSHSGFDKLTFTQFLEGLCIPNCKLQYLDLSGNAICGSAGAAHFKTTLCNPYCKLQHLDLSYNGIGDSGAAHFKEALCNSNCKLQHLHLNYNKIGESGAAHFREALCNSNCKLQHLHLNYNKIGESGAAHFKEALCNPNCKLQHLDLRNNQIGEAGAAHFKEALCNPNCKLQHLDLSNNNIGDSAAAHFKEALCNPNCKLQHLAISGNNIGDSVAAHFKEALCNPNCKLQHLDLGYNNIGESGAAHFKEALCNPNCKLQHLDLRNNCIGESGAAHFKESLCNPNCKLQHLDLSYNRIGESGAAYFKEALCNPNCKLQYLNLSYNFVSDSGPPHFEESLYYRRDKPQQLLQKYNVISDSWVVDFKAPCNLDCEILHLNVSHNGIGDSWTASFKEALCNPDFKLQHLNFSCNEIDDKGAAHFKEALCNPNCKLQQLNLRCNNISEGGAAHFKEALCNPNCKLLHLDLSRNLISDSGVAQFEEALCHPNCKLQHLNLSGNYIFGNGAAHFKEALFNPNCKLQHLDLSNNNFDESGVAHFKEALCNPNCKLQRLDLSYNGIRERCAAHFKEAQSNPKFKIQQLLI